MDMVTIIKIVKTILVVGLSTIILCLVWLKPKFKEGEWFVVWNEENKTFSFTKIRPLLADGDYLVLNKFEGFLVKNPPSFLESVYISLVKKSTNKAIDQTERKGGDK